MHTVYLNHLLVFVDRDTYRALSASGFLNEHFACSEERTTHDQATGMSWTGRYYYGCHTYFEFMNPEKTSWAPRDGLAFGIEAEGGSEDLARRLKQATESEDLVRRLKQATEVEVRRYRRDRRYQDQDIPWFWSVEIPRADDAWLISWVMEYDPGFLDRWAPDLPPGMTSAGTPGIARNRFLTRYRSAIGDDLPDRLFRDITSVTVTLPPDEADLLESELRVYGFVPMKDDSPLESEANSSAGREEGRAGGLAADRTGAKPSTIEKRVTCRGPDLDIVVEWTSRAKDHAGAGVSGSLGDGFGISAFTMETRPVSVTTTHTFGHACRLTVDRHGTANWSFRPNSG